MEIFGWGREQRMPSDLKIAALFISTYWDIPPAFGSDGLLRAAQPMIYNLGGQLPGVFESRDA
jgi:hypothetical protein